MGPSSNAPVRPFGAVISIRLGEYDWIRGVFSNG
jgi:hypothetical protein